MDSPKDWMKAVIFAYSFVMTVLLTMGLVVATLYGIWYLLTLLGL